MTAAPNNYSYYFSAFANERFVESMSKKLTSFKTAHSQIDWWNATNSTYDLHSTMGSLTAPKIGHQQMIDLNQKIKKTAIGTLKNNEALFNKIDSCEITPNGWAILKFKPNSAMQAFHEEFMGALEQRGLKACDFTHQNFMPHVSVGKIKANGDKVKALQELQALVAKINRVPFPFIAYDMKLDFCTSGANGNSRERLVTMDLKRRSDMDVVKVKGKPNTTSKIVYLRTKAKAEKLANTLLHHYGIESAKNPGTPKAVRTVTNGKGKTSHQILLTGKQFERVKGNFDNLG